MEDSEKEYVVEYSVAGFGEQTAGPYATESLAEEHRRDIAGYDGVAWAIVKSRQKALC